MEGSMKETIMGKSSHRVRSLSAAQAPSWVMAISNDMPSSPLAKQPNWVNILTHHRRSNRGVIREILVQIVGEVGHESVAQLGLLTDRCFPVKGGWSVSRLPIT